MLCTRNRWGTGSSCSPKQSNQEAKEVDDKLKKMMAERAKQDTMWSQPVVEIVVPAKKESK